MLIGVPHRRLHLGASFLAIDIVQFAGHKLKEAKATRPIVCVVNSLPDEAQV